MNIDLSQMKIDVDPDFTAENVRQDLKGAFKQIFIEGIHMADVLTDDYNQYQNVTGKDPDDAIRKIYLKELPNLRTIYPGRDDVDIVGYLFSEKLYNAIRKRHEQLQKVQKQD